MNSIESTQREGGKRERKGGEERENIRGREKKACCRFGSSPSSKMCEANIYGERTLARTPAMKDAEK